MVERIDRSPVDQDLKTAVGAAANKWVVTKTVAEQTGEVPADNTGSLQSLLDMLANRPGAVDALKEFVDKTG